MLFTVLTENASELKKLLEEYNPTILTEDDRAFTIKSIDLIDEEVIIEFEEQFG